MGDPVVAIVGRPNVGKSALFNRIIGMRRAIVEETPGVTRDRMYARVEWGGKAFSLVDTGGMELGEADDSIQAMTLAQAQLAIEEADLVIFVVDTTTGIMPQDREVADCLRRSARPVLVVANKAEGVRRGDHVEFFALGFGEPYPVSALHGIGVGDLLDAVLKGLPEQSHVREDPVPDDAVKIAVLGRPNVGKSSLVNAILGEERSIVTPVPGTTRDAHDTEFTWRDRRFVIIDTAGIRRMGRAATRVERYSVLRALKAAERCDVAVAVIDAQGGPVSQDARIVGLADEAGRAVVMAVNKSDLLGDDRRARSQLEKIVRTELAFMSYAPCVFVSALKGWGIPELMAAVSNAAANHVRQVKTSVLNEAIEEAQFRVSAPQDRGRQLKLYYATQVGTRPPAFVFFVNDPDLIRFAYRRYLENALREAFDFEGSPIRLIFRKRG